MLVGATYHRNRHSKLSGRLPRQSYNLGHGTVIVRPDYETVAERPMVASIFCLINPLTGRIRYQ